jgi:uncharacterized membrane protein
MNDHKNINTVRSGLVAASVMIGIGMGGFIDGIIFHQVLQWHATISAILPPDTLVNKSVNMFWDGIFHLFTWTCTATGIAMLWKYVKRDDAILSTRTMVGGSLAGFGLFNFVEGLVDHSILKLHNVRELSENKEMWNLLFLLSGILLLAIGYWLIKSSGRKTLQSSR